MKLKLALAGLLLSAGLAAPASAAPPPWSPAWDLLGSRAVSQRAERDVVPAVGRRHYAQIKICAYQRPVRFYDLDVVFRNGGRQDLAVRAVLNPGQCTRAIDLRGNRRDIRHVTMAYETLGWARGRSAFVRVYGR